VPSENKMEPFYTTFNFHKMGRT